MKKLSLDVKELHLLPMRVRLGFFAFLFVVIVGAGYWFGVAPLQERYQRVVSEERILAQRLELKERSKPNLANEVGQLKSLQEKLTAMLKQLPNSEEIPALIDHIAKSAQKAKLTVDEIKPMKIHQLKSYQQLPIKVSIQGKYPAIESFLKQISQMERIVEVSDFELKPSDVKTPESLKMEMVLNTFIYKPVKKK